MKQGDFIRIDFVGRLESGEIFDLTDEELAKKEDIYNKNLDYGPIPVILGEGFVITGLEEALQDMEIGEQRTVEIPPEKGFGKRDPRLIKTISKNSFGDRVPSPGMVIATPNGARGRIQSVSAGRVRVDFNNPLAGKKLIYKVKILDKVEGDLEKAKSLFKFFRIDANVEKKESKLVIKAKNVPKPLKEKIEKTTKKYTKFQEIEFKDTDKEKGKKGKQGRKSKSKKEGSKSKERLGKKEGAKSSKKK